MRGQAGFWDIDERCARLSEAGDPLEKLDALVAWEVFRKPLAIAQPRDQPGPEIFEIDRCFEHLKRIAVFAQALQMLRKPEKSRLAHRSRLPFRSSP